MRKILAALFLLFFVAKPVLAANNASSVSLSDAIYADLAVRHDLDNVSLYYTNGRQNDNIKLNETRHWLPASTVKTFAAMYAYKLINDRKLNLNTQIAIEAKNEVPTELVTEELPTLLIGDSISIDRLIRQMITQSDNTAFNTLLDVLGRDKITNYIQSLGLIHSRVGSKLNLDTSQEQYEFDIPGYGINTTTAEDYAKAFDLIYRNKIPGAKSLFTILKDQKINNMIPLFLPKEVVCAHKTGDLDPLFHDGGICQSKNQSYIITIFTNAGDPNLLAHLSELIYRKDFNLVGENTQKKSVGKIFENHPIDPLVMNQVPTHVLGTSTNNADLLIPAITAADLGVTSKDLSSIFTAKDLPKVFIPADSPFHILSDAWQVAKAVFAPTSNARLDSNLENAKLRIAEAKDLLNRGKIKEADIVLKNIQSGLVTLSKDKVLSQNSSAQNTIQAVSETRFSILADELNKSKGNTRLALIKEIADQAKDTIKNIQPNIPDATNASNPLQKPLIGNVTNVTPTEIIVRTAGGQEIKIPTNSQTLVKDKGKAPAISPTPSETITQNLTASPKPSLNSIAIGTTVALIGSTTNNKFSPTLILTNVPKELAAPQPVTVAKVDTRNNTMVVVENGIYIQVNINKNTNIKGKDTNIPLKAINPGDIVVVHGEPLTPSTSTNKATSPISAPTVSVNPNTTSAPKANTTSTPQGTVSLSPGPSSIPSPIISRSTNASLSPSPVNPTLQIRTSKTSNIQTQQAGPQTKTPPAITNTQVKVQPVIIQSTSVQVIQKKENVTTPPPASKPSQQIQPQKESKKTEPHKPPEPIISKEDEKKK